MTTQEKVVPRKRSLLVLAEELGNVSKACKVMGTAPSSSTRPRAPAKPSGRRGCSTVPPASGGRIGILKGVGRV